MKSWKNGDEEMPVHPVAEIIPEMAPDQYDELLESIRSSGLREPVVVFQGSLIDGRNRQRACRELGIELKTREWDGKGSIAQYVWDINIPGRHLTADQRKAAAVDLLEYCKKEARDRQREAGKHGAKGGKASRGGKGKLPSAPKDAEGRNGKPRRSSDDAGKRTGVSGREVDKAAQVKRKDPELHKEVKAGRLKLSQARKKIADREKTVELKRKAEAVAQLKTDQPNWTLINQDVLEGLQSVVDHHGPARLIFTDPPYNIGVDYGKGKSADAKPDAEYLSWCAEWIELCKKCLSDDGSFWLMIGDKYADHFGLLLRKAGFHRRAWIKWYETFGVNCANNFNRTSRHIFYCVLNPKKFVFNADAVNRPSDRQTKYGDKRAAESGKVWDDVWAIPRVTGTSTERVPEFPTQLPLELVRAVVGCASEPGDLVVDPFNGSGTTGVASLELGRKYIGIDSSEKFIDLADLRLKGVA